MTNEKAPIAGQGDEGENQNPTYQEENQIVNIIPDTEAARQMVREWATKLAGSFDGDAFQAPDWPKELTPWWVERIDVTYAGGGEAVVDLSRDCGDVSLGTLVTVIVSDAEGWVRKHPGSTVGDFSELDSGIEITITGPHEGMDLVEAGNVFDSLAVAVALLRQIQSGVRA
jgi:hypothetical protein